MIEKIVSEANVAFQLNTELFLELDPPTHEHVHTAPKTEEKTPPAKGIFVTLRVHSCSMLCVCCVASSWLVFELR